MIKRGFLGYVEIAQVEKIIIHKEGQYEDTLCSYTFGAFVMCVKVEYFIIDYFILIPFVLSFVVVR